MQNERTPAFYSRLGDKTVADRVHIHCTLYIYADMCVYACMHDEEHYICVCMCMCVYVYVYVYIIRVVRVLR